MSDIDITALAKLARLEVSDAEKATLEKEIPGILHFVDAIAKANVATITPEPELRNVVRDDTVTHESGEYTERLIGAAPSREGDRIAVKQVISRAKIFTERSDNENPSAASKKAAK